jgi:hypothetical protein
VRTTSDYRSAAASPSHTLQGEEDYRQEIIERIESVTSTSVNNSNPNSNLYSNFYSNPDSNPNLNLHIKVDIEVITNLLMDLGLVGDELEVQIKNLLNRSVSDILLWLEKRRKEDYLLTSLSNFTGDLLGDDIPSPSRSPPSRIIEGHSKEHIENPNPNLDLNPHGIASRGLTNETIQRRKNNLDSKSKINRSEYLLARSGWSKEKKEIRETGGIRESREIDGNDYHNFKSPDSSDSDYDDDEDGDDYSDDRIVPSTVNQRWDLFLSGEGGASGESNDEDSEINSDNKALLDNHLEPHLELPPGAHWELPQIQGVLGMFYSGRFIRLRLDLRLVLGLA